VGKSIDNVVKDIEHRVELLKPAAPTTAAPQRTVQCKVKNTPSGKCQGYTADDIANGKYFPDGTGTANCTCRAPQRTRQCKVINISAGCKGSTGNDNAIGKYFPDGTGTEECKCPAAPGTATTTTTITTFDQSAYNKCVKQCGGDCTKLPCTGDGQNCCTSDWGQQATNINLGGLTDVLGPKLTNPIATEIGKAVEEGINQIKEEVVKKEVDRVQSVAKEIVENPGVECKLSGNYYAHPTIAKKNAEGQTVGWVANTAAKQTCITTTRMVGGQSCNCPIHICGQFSCQEDVGWRDNILATKDNVTGEDTSKLLNCQVCSQDINGQKTKGLAVCDPEDSSKLSTRVACHVFQTNASARDFIEGKGEFAGRCQNSQGHEIPCVKGKAVKWQGKGEKKFSGLH